MEIKQLNSEGLKREYELVITQNTISQTFDERVEEVKKTAKIDGFRKGKIPTRVIKDRYQDAILGEITEKLVQKSLSDLFEKENIKPATQPELKIDSAVKENEDFKFQVNIEVLPEIEHIDYSTISVEKKVAQVDEQEIKDTIEKLAKNSGELVDLPTKRMAKSGDWVKIDFTGSIDGVEFDGGKAENYSLELGSNSFIPGFEDQIIKRKPGESFDVNVKFPEEYGAPNLAGKDAVFAVVLHSIQERQAPELNDDFAKKMGFETFEKLEEAVRNQHKEQYEGLSRSHLKRALLDELDSKFDFEIPQSLFDQELNSIVSQWQQQKATNPESLDGDADKTEEQIREEYSKIAQRRVRLGLVLTDLGRVEEVKITEDERRNALQAEMRRFPGQEQAVLEFFQKNPNAMQMIDAPILEEKVIDLILDKAEVKSVTVTLEELMKDPDADEAL